MTSSPKSSAGNRPCLRRWLLLPVLATVVAGGGVHGAEKTEGVLSVSDAVTAPGRPVRLEARLVKAALLQTGLGGEPVEFLVAGHRIGTAMTGGDGRAYLEYTPRMRGNQTLTVRLGATRRVDSSEATATLASWEKRRPILLVERSALIAPGRPGGGLPDLSLSLARQDPTPEPGASEELTRLSEFYFNLVYVERPGDAGPAGDDFREWLKRRGFPFGLRVHVKAPTSDALAERVNELRAEGWENLKAGVGRSRPFAEGLLHQRVSVIVLTDGNASDLPRKARAARDWREVRKLLQG